MVCRLKSLIKRFNPINALFGVDEFLKEKIKTKQHYCGDMHIHPHNPYGVHLGEGVSSISSILRKAFFTGMRVVANTPHFAIHELRLRDQAFNRLNDKLSKEYEDYEPVIPIYGTEVGLFSHKLIYSFGINQRNADKMEKLGRTLTRNTSLESLIKIEEKFNNGCRVINGHVIPSELSDVRIVVCPAHYKRLRGVGEQVILDLYADGFDLTALEATNSSAEMYQCDLGDVLRKEYGKSGPTDLGGSDAHIAKNVGMGYTSFTVPKSKINDSLDVYDCIVNHQTSDNYLRVPRIKRLVLGKSQYLSPVYWTKFPIFLAVR